MTLEQAIADSGARIRATGRMPSLAVVLGSGWDGISDAVQNAIDIPYAELPRLVSGFHAGIIPFKISPLTAAADPVKAYEMLAAGLPVVAVDLPELRRLAPMITIARDAAEFVAGVEERLGEPPEARTERLELARREKAAP